MPATSAADLLSDDELDAYAAVLETLAETVELPLSLEFVDGYAAALACGPRRVEADECFAALLGEGGLAVCASDADRACLADAFARRSREIARALAAPVETLTDPRALAPFLIDWDDMVAALPAAERAAIEPGEVPGYGEVWAEGFLYAVDTWADDWALPPGSKDESFVDASIEPFHTLTTPEDEWHDAERRLSRDEHVAQAIWGVYELRDFWLDRGIAPVAPIRVAAKPGRNDDCACGSGKKYKKCCGAA